MQQNYINHVVLVLDESGSMGRHSTSLIKAADSLISYLAQRSKELDQETRVTIYKFSWTPECVFYDKDVLRLPSIQDHYNPARGRTALRDATARAIDDLKRTATLYGDHAFLIYVLTDGVENESHLITTSDLNHKLTSLPDNWTVAALVPNATGKFDAKAQGFPAGNVEVWDTTSDAGMIEAGATITRATENFMTARSTGGFKGTSALFSMDPATLNTGNLYKAGMVPLKQMIDYREFDVRWKEPIKQFVLGYTGSYKLGSGYYQLTKAEMIQPQKAILIRNRKTGEVFGGEHARELLGLPNVPRRVTPAYNPDFDVFIQSTSVNRNLMPGTKLLVVLK